MEVSSYRGSNYRESTVFKILQNKFNIVIQTFDPLMHNVYKVVTLPKKKVI